MLFEIKYKLVFPTHEGEPVVYPMPAKTEAEARKRLFSMVRSLNPDLVPETVILSTKKIS